MRGTLDVLTRIDLRGYGFVKRIYVTNGLFSVRNACLTPDFLDRMLMRSISKRWTPCMRLESPATRLKTTKLQSWGVPSLIPSVAPSTTMELLYSLLLVSLDWVVDENTG